MLTIAIEKSIPCGSLDLRTSPAALQVAAMFGIDVDASRTITIIPPSTIPLPYPQRGIVFITGPSGGGKSTLLSLIKRACMDWGRRVIDADDLPPIDEDALLIDAIGCSGDAAGVERAMSMLSLAGLGDAFVMLRRLRELSAGQRHRLALARLMLRADDLTYFREKSTYANGAGGPDGVGGPGAVIVVDEFGATLDRLTAKAIARNVRRWISRGSRQSHTFIAATTHDDLIEALQPDVLIIKGLGDQIEITERDWSLERGRASNDELLDEFTIERGDFADYRRLSQFHYRGRRPGAVTEVWRIDHRECGMVAGVLVRSLPALSCRRRDYVTGGRYAGLSVRESAMLLNREVRTISRVIIDPQWRGMGLAVRLVRHALKHPENGTLFTEALAAMGRVCPFFERAGMTRHEPEPLRHRIEHARLIDALARLEILPQALADSRAVQSKLDACSERDRTWLTGELQHWHGATHRTARAAVRSMSIDELLRSARHELLSQPVYYVFRHDPHGELNGSSFVQN